tara:strand:- start:43 stop:261 length:219 start_codon:yes stop_codon:yes gene_type:complete
MSKTNLDKFWKALKILKSDVQATVHGDVTSEDDFNNNIFWVTGDDNGTAITTKTNPHSELNWAAVKAEMDKL